MRSRSRLRLAVPADGAIGDPRERRTEEWRALSWEPNFTAAANEDFKGYNALFGAFFAHLDGERNDMPTIADGVTAMRVL